jgi:hypothetical protein
MPAPEDDVDTDEEAVEEGDGEPTADDDFLEDFADDTEVRYGEGLIKGAEALLC